MKKICNIVLVLMIGSLTAITADASDRMVRNYKVTSDRHAEPFKHSVKYGKQRHYSRQHSDYDQDYRGYERRHYRNHVKKHYKRHHSHHRDRRVFSRQGRHHANHDGGVRIRIYYQGYL